MRHRFVETGDASRLTRSANATRTGRGVRVAIIDADGVAEHEAFGTRVSRLDCTTGDGDPVPDHRLVQASEGTVVASVAVGAGKCASPAREATLLSYRASTASEIVKALRHAMALGSAGPRLVFTAMWVADDSLYSRFDTDEELPDTIAAVRERGIVLLAAAGNEGPTGRVRMPAAHPQVCAVGGWEEADGQDGPTALDRPHPQSTVDSEAVGKPTFLAPWGPLRAASIHASDNYAVGSGSSVAVGRAAGIVAAWMESDPDLDASRMDEILADPTAWAPLSGLPAATGKGAILER